LNLRPSDYEAGPLDRLDYAGDRFQAEFARSNYVEIGWNLWGMLPHLLPQRNEAADAAPFSTAFAQKRKHLGIACSIQACD